MVQQRAPALVSLRAAKALRVILQHSPAHQQHVAVRYLEASLQLQRLEARRSEDYLYSLAKRRLERGGFVRLDVEDRNFQDHVACLSRIDRAGRLIS
jgi:hypothetical protein